ncbi:hypothetical protein [Inconstantimicrobium mannanitabidum]|uniref:Uncharacterized protein n=1 Tax=Inconstantimicrobium mannanitabidum TaxID=1604901 RepID=A0ACB5RHT2_9CLOT|nr:hypothetical protein [Clostridium sp. TW13]GKX68619.1 hypothetical protein rsdtw13_38770 [Clostridium sp. TW13]
MKNTKDIFSSIGMFTVFFGFWLSRDVVEKYGPSGRIVIMAICTCVVFVVIIILAVMKKFFWAAIFLLGFGLPLIIMFLGLYLNNFIILGGGVILTFAMMPVLIKVANKHKK